MFYILHLILDICEKVLFGAALLLHLQYIVVIRSFESFITANHLAKQFIH